MKDKADFARVTLSSLLCSIRLESMFHYPLFLTQMYCLPIFVELHWDLQQLHYTGNRADDGALTFSVNAQSNAHGLDWGRALTAGLRTDVTATNGTAIDTLASKSFGAQGYLHVTAFTGTNCTITVEDSADNLTFATVASFTSVTGVTSERKALGTATEQLNRYVRVSTTAGTFSSITFAVNLVKNEYVVLAD